MENLFVCEEEEERKKRSKFETAVSVCFTLLTLFCFVLFVLHTVDRLTQLQEELDSIAALHRDSIGLLQRDAPRADDAQATSEFHDTTRARARQLVQSHAFVDELLCSLPSAEQAASATQRERIAALDQESAAATAELQQTVAEVEAWLVQLRDVLTTIGEHRFSIAAAKQPR